eukprot:TRINITY_DN2480_c0_g1_i13.p3 TRINITY_DN2480_c0_g1~~TRINITY_DN2480_c0_g1_i13.p3  ORF type:complete len:166 (-),score=29.21 TRINITY_DN2480_c0_g1_i13:226-723(-)
MLAGLTRTAADGSGGARADVCQARAFAGVAAERVAPRVLRRTVAAARRRRPLPADVARRTVCEELGVASLDEVFVELEEAPVAALSLAQVCHFGVAPAVSRLYRLEVAADGTLAAGAARGWWGKEGGEGGGEATACTLARSHAKTQFKRKRAWQRLKFYWRHRSL